ncbi:MAG: elongation factor P [Luteitalea sp.]|nr:elongation factor P [Acidobacteriota bacterium]
MSTVSATKLRKGHLVRHNNDLCRIVETQHVTPGNLRGFVRAKMRKVKDGIMFEHRFRSEDMVERAILDEREMQYLYKDGTDYYFMDTTSYEQTHMSEEALGDAVNYLLPESMIQVELYDEVPVGIEVPPTVDLKVVNTVPGIKGATASAQTKPATVETGYVVTVPAFVDVGDVLRINTETGEYLSRV